MILPPQKSFPFPKSFFMTAFLLIGLLLTSTITAATFTKKHDFDGAGGAQLTEYNNMLYGVTRSGGANDAGTLFELNPATDTYTKKIDFDGADKGESPVGPLRLYNGKFYGMTTLGGANSLGVLFEWDPAAAVGEGFTKQFDFDSTAKGSRPDSGLSLPYDSGDGEKFYGMTMSGGANNMGVIFEWDPETNTFIKKVDFAGSAKGANPMGHLTLGTNNKFYGMTERGGIYNGGIIFEWDPATNIFTEKTWFAGWRGSTPYGSFTLYNGEFYGTTRAGGYGRHGVFFKWNSTTNSLTPLHHFRGGDYDGADPLGNIIEQNGKLYGVGSSGGPDDFGTIFEWDFATGYRTSHFFEGGTNGDNAGLASVPGNALLSYNGNLYGGTPDGGAVADGGILFKYDAAMPATVSSIPTNLVTESTATLTGSITNTGGTDATVRGFEYGLTESYGTTTTENGTFDLGAFTADVDSLHDCTDYHFRSYATNKEGTSYGRDVPLTTTGCVGPILLEKKVDFDGTERGQNPGFQLTEYNGLLYGVASAGGASTTIAPPFFQGSGVIFAWDPATDTYTKKYDISSDGVPDDYNDDAEGRMPYGSLRLYNNKFYGMTRYGGANNQGVIFEWDPATNIYTTKLDLLAGDTGSSPRGGLSLPYDSGDGEKFYGMTELGGDFDFGVIFEWDPETNEFTKKIDFDGADKGRSPLGYLTLGSNNHFYGITRAGGVNGLGSQDGVIFEWDPTAVAGAGFTKRFDLDKATTGSTSAGSLMFYDEEFYGIAEQGGVSNGTFFKWDPTAEIGAGFTVLHNFDYVATDGADPYGNLTEHNGRLYGFGAYSGINDNGTIFEWSPSTNTYKTIYFFNGPDGSMPDTEGGALLSYGGKLYGATNYGGIISDKGTLFELFISYRKPTLAESTASSLTNTAATLNGNITDTGGFDPTVRGFEYGLTKSYGTTTSENGTFSEDEPFTADITSLNACTTYYFRSYSSNTEGTGYSSDATFTTPGCTGLSPVLTETGETISSTGGAIVELNTGSADLTLAVPIGFATTSSAEFQLHQLTANTVVAGVAGVGVAEDDSSAVGDHIYSLLALTGNSSTITTFDEPLTLSIAYTDDELGDFTEEDLKIFRWDGSTWSALENCFIYESDNTVTCETSHFSTFGVFTTTPPSSGGSSNRCSMKPTVSSFEPTNTASFDTVSFIVTPGSAFSIWNNLSWVKEQITVLINNTEILRENFTLEAENGQPASVRVAIPSSIETLPESTVSVKVRGEKLDCNITETFSVHVDSPASSSETKTTALAEVFDNLYSSVIIPSPSIPSFSVSPALAFADTQKHQAKDSIRELRVRGVVSGKEEGRYYPNSVLSREEMTKIAILAFDFTVDEDAAPSFSDVRKNDWARPYIAMAEKQGIVQGYGNGTFQGERSVSRAEALKIVLEMSKIDLSTTKEHRFTDVEQGAWYEPYVTFALENDMMQFSGNSFAPSKPITRAEMAELIVAVWKHL